MTDIGAWQGDNLQETAIHANGAGSDSGMSPVLRFRRNVARLLDKRLESYSEVMRRDAIGVFLLGAAPANAGPMREPLLDSGQKEVVGHIWFVNEVVKSGKYFTPPDLNNDTFFDYVTDTLNSGGVPAIVFNPLGASPEVRFYPNGLNDPDECEIVAISIAHISLDDILGVLHRVCEHDFLTPDAQVKGGSDLWVKADKFWVRSDAEAVVQAHLKTALASRFTRCIIRHEQSTYAGRIDLEIEMPKPTPSQGVVRLAVIEVKILRAFGSTGRSRPPNSVERWIRGGVRQAAAYRQSRNAQHAILCCFDLRTTDAGTEKCFAQSAALAKQLKVNQFRRFVYHSSEAWRVANLEETG